MASAAGAGMGILGAAGSTASNVMAADVNAKSYDAKARSIERQAEFDQTQFLRQSKFMLGECARRGEWRVDLIRQSTPP